MSLQVKSFKDAVEAQDLLGAYNEFLGILEFIVDYSRTSISPRPQGSIEEITQIQKQLRTKCRDVYEVIKYMERDVLFEKISQVVALFESLEESVSKCQLEQ